MVFWSLGPLPGSTWTGVAWHDELVTTLYTRVEWLAPVFGPPSLLLKYARLGRAPALLHALPGAVWCALAPFQVARVGSGEWRKRSHGTAGRVMLVSAAVLMVGFALIDGSGLSAEVADFEQHGGALADAVNSSVGGRLLAGLGGFNGAPLKGLALWFLFAGWRTYTAARAGDWREHRAWAVRHVGAGLWVAAQRPLYAAVRVAQMAVLGPDVAAAAPALADAFYYCGYATTGLYVVAAELIARDVWRPARTSTRSAQPTASESEEAGSNADER